MSTWKCLEKPPEGFGIPEPWKKVNLKDMLGEANTKIILSKVQWEQIGKTAGWTKEDKIQDIYGSLEELISYDKVNGVCKKLGYEDPVRCWKDNPTMLTVSVKD
jgi:hypothetical protein